jgi:hypothetical protein
MKTSLRTAGLLVALLSPACYSAVPDGSATIGGASTVTGASSGASNTGTAAAGGVSSASASGTSGPGASSSGSNTGGHTSGTIGGGSSGVAGGTSGGTCTCGIGEDPHAVCCGDVCADLGIDSMNCGTCGNACAAWQICQNGACQTGPCYPDAGMVYPAGGGIGGNGGGTGIPDSGTCAPDGVVSCCGTRCCGSNQVCCMYGGGGPVFSDPYFCQDTDAGACPLPCDLCAD